MPHEYSKTVQGHEIGKKGDNRWYVVDTVGKDKGTILGSKSGFSTSQQADSYAQQRSSNYRKRSDQNRAERRG